MNRLRLFLLLLTLVAAGMAALVMASLSGASASAATETIELISKMGGATNAVAVQGNYAYLGEANWLTVVDVSAPDRPVIVGRSPELPGTVSGLAVAGQYAYVISGEKALSIMDIADPTAPEPVGLLEGYEFRGDPALNDNTVLLSVERFDVGMYGLLLLDVSNPAAPVESGFFQTDSRLSAMTVDAAQDLAYVLAVDASERLYVLDVSIPASPSIIGDLSIDGYATSISVSGDYAYVGLVSDLLVIDVSDPVSMATVGRLEFSNDIQDIVASQKYLYAEGYNLWYPGLQIVDISDPDAPELAGFYDYMTADVAVSGTLVYAVVLNHGFDILDTADPAAIERMGHIELIRGSASNIDSGIVDYSLDIEDNYATLLASFESPYSSEYLQILDLTDPENPFSAGFADWTPPWASPPYGNSIDVDSTVALINTPDVQLFYDMKDRLRPELMSGYSSPISVPTMSMEMQRALFLEDCKLNIFSLAHLDNPIRLASYDLEQMGSCGYLVVSGYLAYLLDSGTMTIMDLTNPTNPTITGQAHISDKWASSFVVSGDYAFVEDYSGDGWIIVDVSDPTTPVEKGFLPIPEEIYLPTAIVSEGKYVYLTGYFSNSSPGLTVFDLTVPSAPEQVAFYATRNCLSVQISDGLIYCSGQSTLLILRHNQDSIAPTPTPTTSPSVAANRIYLPVAQHVANYRMPATTRISIDSSGRQANGKSTGTDMTPDGRFVVFDSEATNLVPGDTNGKLDVFIRDRHTGQTTRISVATNGAQGNNVSWGGRITSDGRYVVFNSYATTLVPGDTNNLNDIFLHDRQTGQTTRLSLTAGGAQANGRSRAAAISSDGRYVAFESQATNLADGKPEGDRYGIFLLDRQTNHTHFIDYGADPEVTTGGQFVAYFSEGLYLYERTDGDISAIMADWYSSTNEAYSILTGFSMAGEAQQVAYSVKEKIYYEGDDGFPYYVDRYYSSLYDMSIGENLIFSPKPGTTIDNLAANGQHFVYVSGGNQFLFENFQDGWLLNISATNQWINIEAISRISNDGRIALFSSAAEEVVPNDTNGVQDVFIRDRGTP